MKITLPELETIYPICAEMCRNIRYAKFVEDIIIMVIDD